MTTKDTGEVCGGAGALSGTQFLLSDGAASPGLTALQVMESLGFKTILPWAQELEQVSLSLS